MSLLTLGRRMLNGAPAYIGFASILADIGTAADTNETDLANLRLPPTALERNGAVIRAIAVLRTAANANNKRVRLYLGTTALFDSTAVASNAELWRIELIMTRRTSATQECLVTAQRGTTIIAPTRTAATVDLAATPTPALRVTGLNGTASANDIILSQLYVDRVA